MGQLSMLDWANNPTSYAPNLGLTSPNLGMLSSSTTPLGVTTSYNGNLPSMSDYVTGNYMNSAGLSATGDVLPGTALSGGAAKGIFGQFGDWASQNQAALGLGASLINGLFSFSQGRKSMNLLEKQLNNQIETGERNYQSQRQTVNAQLADRQRARVASNSSYMGVDEYMKKYGV